MAQSFCCVDSNNVLFRKCRVRDYDAKTRIIVPDTHNAIIVNNGIALQTLTAGKYLLFDKKKGVLKDVDPQELEVEIIFVSKTAKLNILWGTETQYDMRDPITGASIKLGASGEFEVQISNPRKAYLELIGQDDTFDTEKLRKRLIGRLLAEVQYNISNVMKEKNLSYDRMGEILLPISNEILPHIANLFEKDYGLRVFSFTISRVILEDKEIEKIENAKAAHKEIEMHKAEKADKERLDNINYQRQLDLKRLEREDYAKYLEVCKIVGWPQGKKDSKSGDVCPNCGVKVEASAKFCPVCGLEFKVTKVKCPNCGKMISKDDMFCKHCGAKVRE